MIVTMNDVVDVGCSLGATFAIFDLGGALVSVAPQDAPADLLPIGRKSLTSI